MMGVSIPRLAIERREDLRGFDQLVPENMQNAIAVVDRVLGWTSTSLCIIILALSAWICTIRPARAHLRRVSFRLMLLTLCFQVAYNITRLFLLARNGDASLLMGQTACATVATVFFQCLTVMNCLITCIAINLVLITCFGINPIERGLEKWYFGGSLAFGLGLPIIPAALGHFGPDPLYGVCYLSMSDQDLRLRVVVAEFVTWQLLSCLVASAAVAATIHTLVRQSRATKRVMKNNLNIIITDLGKSDPDESDPLPHPSGAALGIGTRSDANKLGHRPSTILIPTLSPIIGSPNPPTTAAMAMALSPDQAEYGPPGPATLLSNPNVATAHSNQKLNQKLRWRIFKRPSISDQYGQLHDKVVGVAWRISLYPISLIVVNLVQSVADIYFNYSIHFKVQPQGALVLYVFYRVLYAGRGLVFALLCLLFDPCLKRGIITAWKHTRDGRNDSSRRLISIPSEPVTPNDDDKDLPPMSLGEFMNSSVLTKANAVPETRRPSSQSLDITAALNKLPYYPANLGGPSKGGGSGSRSNALSSSSRTNTFGSGVLSSEGNMNALDVFRQHDSLYPARTALYSDAGGDTGFTKSFAGVASASLPSGLTDDVDVDLRLTYSHSNSRYTPHPADSSLEETPLVPNRLSTPTHVVYGPETREQDIILEPIQPTPRPSLTPINNPARSGAPVNRDLIAAIDRLEVQAAAGNSSPVRPDRPVSTTIESSPRTSTTRKPEETPRKISWGSIPTAPMPVRMMLRRQRQDARESSEARQRKREEREEERRLTEYENQL